MTGAVTNAHNDQSLFCLRTLPNGLPPGMPIHRVACVLLQIEAGLPLQFVLPRRWVLLHLRKVTRAAVVRNLKHKLGLKKEAPYTGRFDRHEIPWFSWPRKWFLPRQFESVPESELQRAQVVTTVLASAEVICRWLWANHLITGIRVFTLFVENPEEIPSVRAFADTHLPEIELDMHPADMAWYESHDDRYDASTLGFPTARQIENLQWAKAQSPAGTWVVTLDIDEVIWLAPSLRKRHPGARPMEQYLTQEAGQVSEVRFCIAEFVPPPEGVRRGVFPREVDARVKLQLGHEPRRMSRFQHGRFMAFTWDDREPVGFLRKIYRILAPSTHDILDDRFLRGHGSSKSVFRAEMFPEVNMHGGIQWYLEGGVREIHPLRLSQEIHLLHFDIFNADQLASKTGHIQKVLAQGDTRSPGRTATLKALDQRVNSGQMTMQAFFQRYVSMHPHARRVARWLGLVKRFDLTDAVDTMPEITANEDVAYRDEVKG